MKRTLSAWVLAAVTATTLNASVDSTPMARGVDTLGLNIFRQIRKTEPGKNIFLSPLSLHEAISMAYVGSEGATRTELAQLLGLDARESNREVASHWKSLREELTGLDAKVKFDIANSMWANKDQRVRFVPDFAELNRSAHDAEMREEDFQDKGFLSQINGWVNEKTHGKIPSILSGEIRKDQLFFLVNAVYFKGEWDVAFDKKLTREEPFTALDGSKQTVKMMQRRDDFQYYADRKLEAVRLPFGKANRFVMTVFLPQADNAAAFLSELNPADIARAEARFGRKEGTVRIPSFKIEYGNEEVVKVLQALGVYQSFTDDAQFPNVAQGEAAKINKIIHKAVIEVNEEGAEAAAATIVGGVRATSISVDRPFYFNANRPFYFEIGDVETGTTVFSGLYQAAQ